MTEDPTGNIRTLLGALFALLSACLFLVLIIALFDYQTGNPGAVFLAFGICAVLAFWLLGGAATWREIQQAKAIETEDIAKANDVREAAETIRAARRDTVTVWPMPDTALFEVPDESTLDRAWDDPDPDLELRSEITPDERNQLFAAFASDPRLNWMVGISDCQARADLMTEMAAERGIRMKKLWALAGDLGPGTIVSGFDGKICIDLNQAKTESMKWNFHVAPVSVVVESSGRTSTVVFDPVLFDCAVPSQTWRHRLLQRGDPVNFEITDRYVYSDPFDVTTPYVRSFRIKARNHYLAVSFDLEDQQTWDGLQMTLRGRYIDDLMQNSPRDYEQFRKSLEHPAFRTWWYSTTSYERIDELLRPDLYDGVTAAEIGELLSSVSPELHEHTIKQSLWMKR